MSLKTGLPPIARGDARVLILGSLPGDASLAATQYYAHPRNHFWSLISAIVGRDLVAMDYPARIKAAQDAGIALWDVVGTAHRPGSLDHKIRRAQVNDLRKFASQLQELQAIAFNGKKAGALAGNVFAGMPLDLVYLPSSSPAYTLSADAKGIEWARLARYLSIGNGQHDTYIVEL